LKVYLLHYIEQLRLVPLILKTYWNLGLSSSG